MPTPNSMSSLLRWVRNVASKVTKSSSKKSQVESNLTNQSTSGRKFSNVQDSFQNSPSVNELSNGDYSEESSPDTSLDTSEATSFVEQSTPLSSTASNDIPESREKLDDEVKEDGEISETDNTDEVVSKVMDILESFALQQRGNDVFYGRDVFSPRTKLHVAAGRVIPMVLPAFPAKSINTVDKVMGPMPDFGEELALDRLNDLCTRVRKVYPPGAEVLIATDGACYNDLTGVTDDNLWQYGVTLRQMVNAKGYQNCIKFIRIMNLLGLYTEETITKEKFISLLEPSRQELMRRYTEPDFDANACIKSDPDYKSTFDGYAKFLKKDLAYGAIRDKMTSGKKYKAMVHDTAKRMIARGVAFAELIREQCPDHVRLSIHPSTGLTKISMPLIPQPDSFSMTPWHCCVAVDTKGNFQTAHVGTLRETHNIVLKSGQEYYFREKSDLWNFEADVEFEHKYDGTLVILLKGGERNQDSLCADDKQRLASLAINMKAIEVRAV